jgi:predicted membrane-bound spermidine synthase
MMQMIITKQKSVSTSVLFKAAAGLAMTALAYFGTIVPEFGLVVTTFNGGIAAAIGAVIGIALTLNG